MCAAVWEATCPEPEMLTQFGLFQTQNGIVFKKNKNKKIIVASLTKAEGPIHPSMCPQKPGIRRATGGIWLTTTTRTHETMDKINH